MDESKDILPLADESNAMVLMVAGGIAPEWTQLWAGWRDNVAHAMANPEEFLRGFVERNPELVGETPEWTRSTSPGDDALCCPFATRRPNSQMPRWFSWTPKDNPLTEFITNPQPRCED